MPLSIAGPNWLKKKFKDELAFRDFQRTLFYDLPHRSNYVSDYKKIFGGGSESPDFHNCVEIYCKRVERYLQIVTDFTTPHILPEEIDLLKKRHAKLVQLLTRSSNLSHILTGPSLYETHICAADIHEAFHKERKVDPNAKIHGTLHPLLSWGEMLMFLPWIQKLVSEEEPKISQISNTCPWSNKPKNPREILDNILSGNIIKPSSPFFTLPGRKS